MGDSAGGGLPLSMHRNLTSAASVALATDDDWSVNSAPSKEVNVVAEMRGTSTSVFVGVVFEVVGGVEVDPESSEIKCVEAGDGSAESRRRAT